MTTRLPIQPILYLAITGLAAGSVWQFYEAFQQQRQQKKGQELNNQIVSDFNQHMELGRSRQPEHKTWNPELHKTSFRDANLTGKLPPKPVETDKPAEDVAPPTPPQVPLADIFELRALCYQSGSLDSQKADSEDAPEEVRGAVVADQRGNQTSVVIVYHTEANVEPPEDVLAAVGKQAGTPRTFTPGDSVRPRTTNQRGGRNGRPTPPRGRGATALPSFGGNAELTHTVYLDETLWPPYDHIRLVRVDEGGLFAVFEREVLEDGSDEFAKEKVFKAELGLSQDLLAKLASLEGQAGRPNAPIEPGSEQPIAAPRDNGWISAPTTRVIDDQVHVGEDLADKVRREPDKLFTSLGLRSYSSRGGSVKGLQISSVPSELSSFGFQRGDVIISVNGKPVTSKQQAYSVGKRQYQGGERTFEVEMITNGKRETRTILAPNR